MRKKWMLIMAISLGICGCSRAERMAISENEIDKKSEQNYVEVAEDNIEKLSYEELVLNSERLQTQYNVEKDISPVYEKIYSGEPLNPNHALLKGKVIDTKYYMKWNAESKYLKYYTEYKFKIYEVLATGDGNRLVDGDTIIIKGDMINNPAIVFVADSANSRNDVIRNFLEKQFGEKITGDNFLENYDDFCLEIVPQKGTNYGLTLTDCSFPLENDKEYILYTEYIKDLDIYLWDIPCPKDDIGMLQEKYDFDLDSSYLEFIDFVHKKYWS